MHGAFPTTAASYGREGVALFGSWCEKVVCHPIADGYPEWSDSLCDPPSLQRVQEGLERLLFDAILRQIHPFAFEEPGAENVCEKIELFDVALAQEDAARLREQRQELLERSGVA